MTEQWQDKPEVHTPPVPINGMETHVDVMLTARSFWTQPIAPREGGDAYALRTVVDGRAVELGAARRVARGASETPNPLRELAASLVAFADQLDVNGLIPVGVNVVTRYEWSDFLSNGQGQRAVVVTTVRGVRREWVAEALEENT